MEFGQVDEPDAIGEVAKWSKEIELYTQQAQKWVDRSKKIVKRFKDDRDAREDDARFNMLWSNIQTLSPALFAKNPKANVERRYQDDDDLGRFASEVLERCVSYYIDERFFDTTQQCVLDRLLPGRAVMWIRYVPTFGADGEVLTSEEIVNDYVNWMDYGHTWARTPEEIKAIWRKVYMGRGELMARFGEKVGKRIPLDYAPAKLNDEKISEQEKKATIYEIWNKPKKTVVWIHKDYPDVLDTKKDPLKLKDFWPIPRPMYATLANDSCIPVPDYQQYQDQAMELDDLTGRISMLSRAVKVVGVYDASKPAIERIMAEGIDNALIPVDQWAMLGEKGLAGVIAWMPLKDIVEGLKALFEMREKVKQDAYEISGMSDIIRGQGDSNETATGVKTKGQFATLRLSSMQGQVSRFCRDAVRIMAEIIAEHYSLDTIKSLSGVKLLMQQEKQLLQYVTKLQQQAQQPPQPGQPPMPPPPMPPLPPELQKIMDDPEKLDEMMENPTWEEVHELLKNDTLRCFRIDIEVDSTIKQDQEAEKQGRVEFLQAAGGFIQQAAAVQDPDLQPLLAQMLMFGVRGFHAGKDLESAFEIYIKKVEKKAADPQPPPQDPKIQLEQQKLAMQQQQSQAEMQHTSQIAQKDAALEQQKMQSDQSLQAMQFSHDRDLQQMKLSHEQLKEELKAQLAIQGMKHQAQVQGATQGNEHSHAQAMQEMQHSHEKSMPKPKAKE